MQVILEGCLIPAHAEIWSQRRNPPLRPRLAEANSIALSNQTDKRGDGELFPGLRRR